MTGKKKKKPVKIEWKTAYDVFLERQNIERISTGTPIDELIGGGVELGECVEFYGEYGSGKTQACLTLTVNVAAEEKDVVSIDTENTFKPERVLEIAEKRGYNPEQILSHIHLAKPLTTDELQAVFKQIPKTVQPKLVVVDSLTTLFREEYIGRGNLATRQGELRTFIVAMKRYARENNCAVIVTNQVYGSPEATPFLPLHYRELAVGGHTLYHLIDNRIFFRKAAHGTRIARLVDSSRYPEQERPFRITEKGIENVEENTE